MAIKNRKDYLKDRKEEIDLTGPDGNAYVLLGKAKNFATMLGLNWEEINKEMTSGDYNNLVKVFDKYFGHIVDLYKEYHEK